MNRKHRRDSLSVWRVLGAILLPPLAVLDKGWDKILITTLLWLFMWPVGMAVAFYFLLGGRHYDTWKANLFGPSDHDLKVKHEEARYTYQPPAKTREYIELADGEVLEVVDPDDEERMNRLSR